MKIEEQVLSREQMAHLVELGVDTSDASMMWYRCDDGNAERWYLQINNELSQSLARIMKGVVGCLVPTYTIGDLEEKLPKTLRSETLFSWLVLSTDGCDDPLYSAYYEFEYGDIAGKQTGDTSIEARYKLLCWVAENHKELIN